MKAVAATRTILSGDLEKSEFKRSGDGVDTVLVLVLCSTWRRVSRPERAFGSELFAVFEPFNCPRLGTLTELSCTDSVSDNLIKYVRRKVEATWRSCEHSLVLLRFPRLLIGAGIRTTTVHTEEWDQMRKS